MLNSFATFFNIWFAYFNLKFSFRPNLSILYFVLLFYFKFLITVILGTPTKFLFTVINRNGRRTNGTGNGSTGLHMNSIAAKQVNKVKPTINRQQVEGQVISPSQYNR